MPSNLSKLYSMLGFAQKAGKVASGDGAVVEKIKRKEACLVIIASDAAEDTRNRAAVKARENKIPCLTAGTKLELGLAVGKSPRALVALMDQNFANNITKLMTGGR